MTSKLTLLIHIILMPILTLAQQVSIQPFSKIETGLKYDVTTLNFSENGEQLILVDQKGNIQLWDFFENKMLLQNSLNSKIEFVNFLEDQKQIIAISNKGLLLFIDARDLKVIREVDLDLKVANAELNPSKNNISILSQDGIIHVYDIQAKMSRAKSDISYIINKPLFMGFDRFGQRLACISNLGDVAIWNPIDQKVLKQLKLQSGEYYGSKSILHSASTSKGSDYFVVSLQEVFIPKGGLKNGQQPERRNMVVVYDWQSGNETKRIKTNNRVDDIAYGPGPENIIVSSRDKDEIQLLNINRGEEQSAVDLDDEALQMSISENNQWLAVGSHNGAVFIYDLQRNATANIQITNPIYSRGQNPVEISQRSLEVKGKVSNLNFSSEVLVNEQKVAIDNNGNFSAQVDLIPGKNRISVIASDNNANQVIKDVYVNRIISGNVPESNAPIKAHHSSSSQKRVALVIGNANYSSNALLQNPVNDANAMADVLTELNFEVIKVLDGDYEKIKNTIYEFGSKIQDVDVSLFYYAGHGIEVDGENYIVPVDAVLESPIDVKQKTIPVTGILKTIEYSNEESLNLIILDACRNNPFPTGKRGGAGLAKETAPSGTLIAYATDPGSVASDGVGENGLYTGELVKQLRIPQRIEDVFMNTRNNVEDLSNSQQRPWEEARLKGVFYLKY